MMINNTPEIRPPQKNYRIKRWTILQARVVAPWCRNYGCKHINSTKSELSFCSSSNYARDVSDRNREREREEREERERRERVSSWFFVTVTYNVIIIHIFPENLIKIPHLFRRYEDFFLQYLLFSSIFFFFFDLSLLQKKLITSSCNKWCWDFLYLQTTLNKLFAIYLR